MKTEKEILALRDKIKKDYLFQKDKILMERINCESQERLLMTKDFARLEILTEILSN